MIDRNSNNTEILTPSDKQFILILGRLISKHLLEMLEDTLDYFLAIAYYKFLALSFSLSHKARDGSFTFEIEEGKPRHWQ